MDQPFVRRQRNDTPAPSGPAMRETEGVPLYAHDNFRLPRRKSRTAANYDPTRCPKCMDLKSTCWNDGTKEEAA